MAQELYSLRRLKGYLVELTDGSVAELDCFWFLNPASPGCRITHVSVGPFRANETEIGIAPTSRISSMDDERRLIHLGMTREELTHGGPYRQAVAALKARPSYNSEELEGCLVSARGQESGTIVNFIIDVGHWDLRFFELDIGDKEVLVEPVWTNDIDLFRRKIRFDLPASAIAEAPAYQASAEVNRGYCEALYKHYSRHQHLH